MAKAKAAKKGKAKVRVSDLGASKKRASRVKGGLNFTRGQK